MSFFLSATSKYKALLNALKRGPDEKNYWGGFAYARNMYYKYAHIIDAY
jgi:hypothetical protein